MFGYSHVVWYTPWCEYTGEHRTVIYGWYYNFGDADTAADKLVAAGVDAWVEEV